MNTYLLVFNKDFGDRETVVGMMKLLFLEELRSDIPNVFYLRTDKTIKQLMIVINQLVSTKCWYLLFDITNANCNGSMPYEAWRFLISENK